MRMRLRKAAEDLVLAALIAATAIAAAWSLAPVETLDDIAADAAAVGMDEESFPPYLRDYRFLWESVQRSESPLWRPDEALGFPFFAEWSTRCLSPFTLPFYVFSWGVALRLSLLLKFAVAGLGAYYAARRLGFLPAFALGVALLFQLAPMFTEWIWYPAVDAAAWTPVLLLFAERLAIGQYRFWPVGALVCALVLSSGAVFAVVWLAVLLTLYILLRSLGLRPLRSSATSVLVFAASWVIGGGLLAMQVLPWVELTQHAIWNAHDTPPLVPHDALRMVTPAHEDPAGGRAASLLYVGSASVLLLGLWMAVRHAVTAAHRRRIDCLLLLAVLAPIPAFVPFATVYAPPVAWLAALPFLAGMVGAAAAETWLLLTPEQCAPTIRRYVTVLIGFAVIGAAAYWAANATAAEAMEMLTPALFLNAAAALCLIIVLGLTLLRPSFPVMGYSVAGLILITRLAAIHPGGPVAWAAIEDVAAGPEKNVAIAGDGHAPAGDWTLARTAAYQTRALNDAGLLRSEGREMLELSAEEIRGLYAPLRSQLHLLEVLPDAGAVFRDSRALPQAALVYEGRQRQEFAPEDLAGDASPLIEAAVAMGPHDEHAKVEELYSANTYHEYAVNTASPAVLMLAEAWYPGWEASVNGVSMPVFPVNVAFRGVALLPGQHHIAVTFSPESIAQGLRVSAWAGALVVLGLLLLPILRARKKRR